MPALLDDFNERNMRAAIVVSPECRGHPGVHGIDARFSPLGRPPLNGTIFRRFFKSFRSMEFFRNLSR
ncbi:hypothetical protein [Burkholderia cepacia]|uniref:hypothetical protein n=1 Tax=Burkholderia cepacia TaxID=292 RepID=UPI0016515BCE|nr:hypothetical protein [Burkholderia cepacia]